VLTASGGNVWLAEGLARSIRAHAGERLLTGAAAFRVAETEGGVQVDLWRPAEQGTLCLVAAQLIWAAPLFLVPHLFVGYDTARQMARGFTNAPWLIANLTLSRLPETRAGRSTAWDNVLFDSPGLGYVVATHQQLRLSPGAAVVTYYRALTGMMPQQGRTAL
jgi:hypothetical protein